MTELVPAEQIERIVGTKRHATRHLGCWRETILRAVDGDQ